MVTVNRVQKSGHMDLWDVVKLQIRIHCHLGSISISDSDLECLTLLAINGESELTSFCNSACLIDERDRDHTLKHEREIFKTPQSVRNSINKLDNMSLIEKKGRSRKKISVNQSMQIQAEGNIFIDIKFLRKDEPKEA